MKVWEASVSTAFTSSAARVPTAFLVLANFHSCFYNSIETRYMFSILKYYHVPMLPYSHNTYYLVIMLPCVMYRVAKYAGGDLQRAFDSGGHVVATIKVC